MANQMPLTSAFVISSCLVSPIAYWHNQPHPPHPWMCFRAFLLAALAAMVVAVLFTAAASVGATVEPQGEKWEQNGGSVERSTPSSDDPSDIYYQSALSPKPAPVIAMDRLGPCTILFSPVCSPTPPGILRGSYVERFTVVGGHQAWQTV